MSKYIDLTEENESEPPSKISRTEQSGCESTPKASTFYMNRFNGVNNPRQCLSIRDIFREDKPGDIMQVMIAHYSSSFSYLLNECPILRHVPVLFLVPGALSELPIPHGWSVSAVRKDFGYEENSHGSFHSKLGLIFYSCGGVRILISTNNFLEDEQNNLVGAFYVEDFPSKQTVPPSLSTRGMDLNQPTYDFGADLRDYLRRQRLQDQSVVPILNGIIDLLSEYDFSSAEVVLIPSIPGRHRVTDSKKWGHWRLRQVLMDATKSTTTSDSHSSGSSSSSSSCSAVGQLQLDDYGFPPVRQGIGKGAKSGGNSSTKVSTTPTSNSSCASSVNSSSSSHSSSSLSKINIGSSSSGSTNSSSSATKSSHGCGTASALEGTIVMQSSSLASTTKKWMEQLCGSMSLTQMMRRSKSTRESS